MRDRLVVLIPDDVGLDGGRIAISTKTLDGLHAYRKNWPGDMTVAVRRGAWRDDPVHHVARPAELPFEVEVVEHPGEIRSRDGAAVTLAMHLVDNAVLLERDPRRLVLYGEFPLAERILSARLGARGLGALRATAGWWRRGPLLKRMVTKSGGFQSNGHPAWDEYAASSPSPMLYYDTRVTADHVTPRSRERHPSEGSLRLAFSGRHIAAKGPDAAVAAALTLMRDGCDVTLDLFGDGPQMAELRESARSAPSGRIRFHGLIPFDPEWTDYVRSRVDLMVLPHMQGDPSGTYLETAALGIPVIGFANRALESLVARYELGWTVPVGDAAALSSKIALLATSAEERERAGNAGRRMMARHTAVEEFSRRVDHLRDVAGV